MNLFSLRLVFSDSYTINSMDLKYPERPAILASAAYLKGFERVRHRIGFRDWAMDSGAYTFFNSGRQQNLDTYIATCLRLKDDPALVEIYALDDMGGEWRQTLRNTQLMWAQGIQAIPTFHVGEPWDVLRGYAADFPKVALGGMSNREAGLSSSKRTGMHWQQKVRWCTEAFSHIWPKKVHGFGCGAKKLLLKVPFHSVDASSWVIGPAMGRWTFLTDRTSKNAYLGIRDAKMTRRAEVEWSLRMEREIQSRWQRELESLC